MEREKTVQIGEQRFLIKKMTARNGSWVIGQLLTKLLPGTLEAGFQSEGGVQLPANRAQISEDEFHNVQDHALKVCFRLERQGNGVDAQIPVMTEQGTWAIKELEDDIVAVAALTIHSLVFSVSAFFDGDVLKQALGSFKNLNLPSTSK